MSGEVNEGGDGGVKGGVRIRPSDRIAAGCESITRLNAEPCQNQIKDHVFRNYVAD